jgi:hypothetical protein
MPWSIDGPSSEQLGYLRREPEGSPRRPQQDRPTRRRRWLWVALPAGVLVLLAVTRVVTRPERPAIATKAVGSWREIDTSEGCPLVLMSEGSLLYHVLYARVEGDHGLLRDDTIVVLREWPSGEVTCILNYDTQHDRLTAATGKGTFTLERAR